MDSGNGPRPQARAPRVDRARDDDTVERLAWLMDRSIPLGGGYTIGLDPIIGLVPGLGDFVTTAVSSLIVLQAYRAGIPKSTLMRMVANVGIDAAVGAIPFAGDVFDFVFKANSKNLQLYREAIAGTRDTRRDVAFLLLLVLMLAALVAIPVALLFWAVQATVF